MYTGLRKAKTAVELRKNREKTEKKGKQTPKNRAQGAADTLKGEKSVRKRTENRKETVKKPKRNSKMEQKGRKTSSGQGKKQRRNTAKQGAEGVKIQQTCGRIRKNPLKSGKTREFREIFCFFRR